MPDGVKGENQAEKPQLNGNAPEYKSNPLLSEQAGSKESKV